MTGPTLTLTRSILQRKKLRPEWGLGNPNQADQGKDWIHSGFYIDLEASFSAFDSILCPSILGVEVGL